MQGLFDELVTNNESAAAQMVPSNEAAASQMRPRTRQGGSATRTFPNTIFSNWGLHQAPTASEQRGSPTYVLESERERDVPAHWDDEEEANVEDNEEVEDEGSPAYVSSGVWGSLGSGLCSCNTINA